MSAPQQSDGPTPRFDPTRPFPRSAAESAGWDLGYVRAWRILVVVARGVYVEPGRTLQRIHRLLLGRREPGVPRVVSEEWRRHVPGRS